MPEKIEKYPRVAPVVKWVGGKRQLLDEIIPLFPSEFNCYYEPFFGGGAVLFRKKPKKAVINDLNGDLIKVYRCIKDDPESLIEELKKYKNDKEEFYKERELDRDKTAFAMLSDVRKAARLIYLNKTCFNGLYRVNSAGEFNTPFAAYKKPNIVNAEAIRAVHAYFNENDITIMEGDFAHAVAGAKKGDFVYFDPPYDPISNSAAFTGYSEDGFGKSEQKRLCKLCEDLTNRGVKIMLSNSSTDFIHNLYNDPKYKVRVVRAKRAINSIGTKRGEVDEVLITNY